MWIVTGAPYQSAGGVRVPKAVAPVNSGYSGAPSRGRVRSRPVSASASASGSSLWRSRPRGGIPHGEGGPGVKTTQRGGYAFPYASSMKQMAEEGFIARQNLGPVGFMQVLPKGPIKMGGALLIWFLYSALLATFAGYIGTLCLARGADYHEVFRITGTVALLGFAPAPIQDSIWRGVQWAVTARFVFGGILYGLVTAGVFGAMWPGV